MNKKKINVLRNWLTTILVAIIYNARYKKILQVVVVYLIDFRSIGIIRYSVSNEVAKIKRIDMVSQIPMSLSPL